MLPQNTQVTEVSGLPPGGVTWLASLAHQRPGLRGSTVFLVVSKHVAKRRVLLLQPFNYSSIFCIIQIEICFLKEKKSLECFKFFSKSKELVTLFHKNFVGLVILKALG